MDYLLIVEISLIALVVAALALLYTYVLVDYLWSYDRVEEVRLHVRSFLEYHIPLSCLLPSGTRRIGNNENDGAILGGGI